jgi:hypothetical protein
LVPVLLYLIFHKKINDKAVRVIFYLLVIGFLFDSYQIYSSSQGSTTYLSSNLFTLIETLFLYFFFKIIIDSRLGNKIIYVLAVAFSAVWIYLFIKAGTTSYIETLSAIETLTLISLSIYYFWEQLRKPDTVFLYTVPRFWLVTAYLTYTTGTFFLFLYLDSLSIVEQQRYFVYLNPIFLLIKTIMLSIAMLMRSKIPQRKKFQLT